LADLGRFSQLLEQTQHFCGCGDEKVAKIVQCGEQNTEMWRRYLEKVSSHAAVEATFRSAIRDVCEQSLVP
jgi:hypothetical protein